MSKLKTYREAKGISQAAFAQSVGVKKAAISRIERGTRVPSMGLVSRICTETKGELTANDFMPAPEPETAA